MIIGVDFDNTIVCYDALFHRVALERGLIPAELPVNKTAVRDHLRTTGREAIWTEMQGEVYGARMAEAAPYPGVIDFFRRCREQQVPVCIISHKTRHPYLGERHDLHAAARNWLQLQGFFDPAIIGLQDGQVYFELTKEAKLERIATCGCTHFIDDLPELLRAPLFPANVNRYLFDPERLHPGIEGLHPAASWSGLAEDLLGTLSLVRVASALAGLSGEPALRPLAGGANNQVYKLGDSVVVKRYFQHSGDPRDRFAAEHAFYHFANAIALTSVPRVLGWDVKNRLGVFEFVEGPKPTSATPAYVDEALRFFAALNQPRASANASALPLAAEACLSLTAHLSTVHRRVEGVLSLPHHDDLGAEAARFVGDGVLPLWEHISAGFQSTHTADDRRQELPLPERCISPSDFGFHNALVRKNGSLAFLDFEYAGWDDPAKLVCDFFCQPDLPVPPALFEHVIASVAGALQLTAPETFAARCRSLLPVYQIKWACILLNDFTEIGRSRREFSLGLAEASARRQRQLTRARQILATLLITV